MRQTAIRLGLFLGLTALCLSCGGPAKQKVSAPAKDSGKRATPVPREKQFHKDVVASARRHLGESRIVVDGRLVGNDCSAFVLGVYAPFGLYPVEPAGGGSRTRMIYRWLEQRGRIIQTKRPRPGDLAFFHNTYDRNGDGRANDLFTHVAVVEKVEADGTITLLHRGSSRVDRLWMNLYHPRTSRSGGRVLNSVLRSSRNGAGGAPLLAGELFAAFGSPVP